MNSRAQSPTDSRHCVRVPQRRPLRFRIGVGLLILYPLMWVFAAIVPFFPLDTGVRAAVIAGDLAAAEAIGLLGIACVGKETYQAIKSRLRRGKSRRRATPPDPS